MRACSPPPAWPAWRTGRFLNTEVKTRAQSAQSVEAPPGLHRSRSARAARVRGPRARCGALCALWPRLHLRVEKADFHPRGRGSRGTRALTRVPVARAILQGGSLCPRSFQAVQDGGLPVAEGCPGHSNAAASPGTCMRACLTRFTQDANGLSSKAALQASALSVFICVHLWFHSFWSLDTLIQKK